MGNSGLSASAESVHFKQRSSTRRTGSKHFHRSSSRRNKENGSRSGSIRGKQNPNVSNISDTSFLKRTKNRVVSFEQSTAPSPQQQQSSNSGTTISTITTPTTTTSNIINKDNSATTTSRVMYNDSTQSIDRANTGVVENQTEFSTNSLNADSDLMVHDWQLVTNKSDAKSHNLVSTPSKPPRI